MQVSNTQSVFNCFCEINELGHNVAYLLQTPHVPVTGQVLLDAYNHYLDWYNGIPTALRLGINYTPSVFIVHIYYQCAIMLLFRPYIRLRIKGQASYHATSAPRLQTPLGASYGPIPNFILSGTHHRFCHISHSFRRPCILQLPLSKQVEAFSRVRRRPCSLMTFDVS